MAKILPNRISKTLSEGNVTAAKDAIKILIDILGTPVAISDDDYKALAKLGDVLKPVCDKVLLVAKEEPSYLEEEQPVEEIEKDKAYFEQLTEILKPLYNAVFLYEREQSTTGAEYRNAIHNYEGNVKAKVSRGSSSAQLTLDKLNRIDRGTKPSPSKSSTTPPVAT
jgi:hypothetical protein